MCHKDKIQIEIVTGQYQTADLEEKQMIRGLMGANVEYDYEIYFHWYNIIHELGHAILDYNSESKLHPADEEQIVNDFAFAYWSSYGEPDKLSALCKIVWNTIGKFKAPVEDGVNHIDFYKNAWRDKELYSFNNYGWFQFSCVQDSITKHKTLEQVIDEMGIPGIKPYTKATLVYPVDSAMPYKVLKDAVNIFKQWEIFLPENIKLVLVNDPNCHMCRTVNDIHTE